jgi:hypothetical protein
MTTKTLGRAEFERALDLTPGSLDQRTGELLDKTDLRFRPIAADEQARLEAETERQIAAGFSVVGEHRAGIWRDAWQEHLERFEQAGYALEALNPNFVLGSSILRWQGAYIESITELFELRFFEIFRDWLFRRFLGDVGHLYEFGSGSAFNVAAYARLFPETPITALDWAPAAVRIAELLKEKLGMKVSGRRFNFFEPDKSIDIARDGAVLTNCALEQTGERFGTFLDFLLEKRPKRVVHVEPTVELYDSTSAHDRLAIRYHDGRKYLRGLLPALERLAADRRIRLRFARRLRFGSRFHECYSVLVWEPANP